MYQTILFDLDGTLSDSGDGITNSVSYALEQMGVHEPDRSRLYRFIGPPLYDSFMRFYGMDHATAQEAVRQYRVYYSRTGIWENRIYDGIPALLNRLHAQGRTLAVASSKPETFVRMILEHFALAPYFAHIVGATMDESRISKADVIACALEQCALVDKSSAIMVGDREHDVFGAAENGLPCIGVLYGYGSRAELTAAGANYIADDVAALGTVLQV